MRSAIVLCVLLAPAVAAAQQAASAPPAGAPRIAGGVGVRAAIPVGEFASHVDDAVGVLGHLDARLGRGPLRLGGETGYLEYGHDERTVPLRPLVPDMPDGTLKVDTDNRIFFMHARLRAQRMRGRWRPYADGLIGFSDLFTKTSIDAGLTCGTGLFGGTTCSSSNVESTTNSRDVVLSYGFGGGASYGFDGPHLRLDLSLRYMRGGQARYLTEGAIRIVGSEAVLDFSESRTDDVSFYIGLAWPR